MIIDSHLHLWRPSAGGYGWLRPEHGVLNDDHGPEDIAPVLARLGVDHVVLVQADDTVADTQFMVDVAAAWPVVAGVVGWVQLDAPTVAAAQLEQWGDSPVVKGIRHLVHNDPRADFLELPAVQDSLSLLAERGYALDLPDAWPGGFAHQVAPLADRHPELTIVVDHLTKPPHGAPDFAAWAAMLRDVARRPNTVAKLSGLADSSPSTAANWRPAYEVAVEAFGPTRLMYGSDWPITRLGLDYAGTWAVLTELISSLAPDEQDAILGGNAARVYRLNDFA